MIAYALIFLQVCWVLLALGHRLQEKEPMPAPMVGSIGFRSVLLTYARALAFVLQPLRKEGALEPAYLSFDGPAPKPNPQESLVDGLVVYARSLKGAPFILMPLMLLLLTMGVVPVSLMFLAAYGIYIGDVTAKPDALAALGAFVVASACLWSGRHHTKTPWVSVFFHPLAALVFCLSLTLAMLPKARS